MEKYIIIAILSFIAGYAFSSIITKKPKHDIEYQKIVADRWSLQTQPDSSTIQIIGNTFPSLYKVNNSFVYEYILPRKDSIVTGQIYTNIPYEVPFNDQFHEIIYDNEKLYIRFVKVQL
ncbi:MAG: hypothetical protein ACOXZV_00635 [Bacteroidales bacterium]|jgi:hypothetical protein